MSQDSQIVLDDLTDETPGVALNAEELQAVSGARIIVCDCGRPLRADDWVL